MESKKCPKCGIQKPLTDFYKSIRDGHASRCKECEKSVYKAYMATPEGRAKRAEVRRRYRQNNRKRVYETRHKSDLLHPEKKRARSLIGHRIERGHWKRPPCEVCGIEKSQAHHPDYSKPLEVIWLCQEHHIQVHRKAA